MLNGRLTTMPKTPDVGRETWQPRQTREEQYKHIRINITISYTYTYKQTSNQCIQAYIHKTQKHDSKTLASYYRKK